MTNAADPWQITAIENVIPGYSQVVCLQCTSNNAAPSPFEKTYMITQSPLDCSPLLTAKAALTIDIPYLDGGSDLTKIHTDFFTVTATTECSVVSCNYGDTCGESTTISVIGSELSKTSVAPYTLTYKQNVKNGYGQ